MKKPKLQVLLEAFKNCDMPNDSMVVDLMKPGSERICFWTSHQVFQQITVEEPRVQNNGIPFVIHEYSVNPFGPLLSVTTTKQIQGKMLSCAKTMPASKQTKLPFGLKPPTRKRKQTKKTGGEPMKKQQKGNDGLDTAASLIKRVEQRGMNALFSEAAGLANEASSGSHERPPPSDLSAAVSDSGESSEGSENDQEDLDGEVPFLTPEVIQEQLQVKAVFQMHEDLAHQACQQEAETPGNPSSSSSGVSGPSSSSMSMPPSMSKAPLPSSSGKSFCNATLGLVEAGLQTSARLATCRHCLTKIAKGEVRYGYAWSRVKFHSWLHAACAHLHLKQENSNIADAVHFLEGELAKGNKESRVMDATRKLLQDVTKMA